MDPGLAPEETAASDMIPPTGALLVYPPFLVAGDESLQRVMVHLRRDGAPSGCGGDDARAHGAPDGRGGEACAAAAPPPRAATLLVVQGTCPVASQEVEPTNADVMLR